jgi:hypothetical protein
MQKAAMFRSGTFLAAAVLIGLVAAVYAARGHGLGRVGAGAGWPGGRLRRRCSGGR